MLWDIVLFPTSDVKGVSTYKIPNYPHALSHTVCGDQKLTEFNLLETLFCILKNAYRCLSRVHHIKKSASII